MAKAASIYPKKNLHCSYTFFLNFKYDRYQAGNSKKHNTYSHCTCEHFLIVTVNKMFQEYKL